MADSSNTRRLGGGGTLREALDRRPDHPRRALLRADRCSCGRASRAPTIGRCRCAPWLGGRSLPRLPRRGSDPDRSVSQPSGTRRGRSGDEHPVGHGAERGSVVTVASAPPRSLRGGSPDARPDSQLVGPRRPDDGEVVRRTSSVHRQWRTRRRRSRRRCWHRSLSTPDVADRPMDGRLRDRHGAPVPCDICVTTAGPGSTDRRSSHDRHHGNSSRSAMPSRHSRATRSTTRMRRSSHDRMAPENATGPIT